MTFKRIRQNAIKWILPAFLCFAVICGGASHDGQLIHLWIQFAAVAVTLFALKGAIHARWPLVLLGFLAISILLVLWTSVQLIPLPETAWSALGDRTVIKEGYSLIGIDASVSLPISLGPEDTTASLLGFVPPFAVLILAVALGWSRAVENLKWVIPILGSMSALLGLAQVFLGPETPLYFYGFTSRELPVGFFSNANHQATLLLMCLPFVAALAGQHRQAWRSGDEDIGKAMLIGVMFVLQLVGILAVGSVAGYALLAPVLVLSILLLRGRGTPGRDWITRLLVSFSFVAAALLVGFSPVLDGLGITSFENTELSRLGIWDVTGDLIKEHQTLGSGLGTYDNVYRLHEDPTTVTSVYVKHAHNDYLEVLVEWGMPGSLLVGAGLCLWLYVFIGGWMRQADRAYRLRRAASISTLVIVLHSLVDYPLRTPAIAVLGTVCLAIMLLQKRSQQTRSRTALSQAETALKHKEL